MVAKKNHKGGHTCLTAILSDGEVDGIAEVEL